VVQIADQHNPNIPALGNSIASDVVDIKENLEFHKDCFEAICEGWSNASAASLAIGTDKVATAAIQDDAVTQGKIADNAVGNAQMRQGAVDTDELTDAAVETAKIADANVTQAKLKTSTGSVNSADDDLVSKTLPGGTYGFYPQIKMSVAAGGEWKAAITDSGVTGFTSYTTHIALEAQTGAYTIYAQQRYVTSSGEVHWIFILRNKVTKEILSVWQAPDHPCFGNSDKPSLRPHPHLDFDEAKHEMIVINPSKEQVLEMKKKTIVDSETEPDKDLIEVILDEYDLDETIQPAWPTKPVTVGLPPEWEEKPIGANIVPIKKIIPRPAYIKTAGLKIKKVTPNMGGG